MIYFPEKNTTGLENIFNYIKLHLKQQYFKLLRLIMKIFHLIKGFFIPETAADANQAWRLSKIRQLLHWLLIFGGGALMAAAFPPLNLTLTAFLALTVLWLEVRNRSPWKQ